MELPIEDVRRLCALHEAIESVDLHAPPTAHVISPQPWPTVRRLGLLCGSFNPLTLAHTELAERAREVMGLDLVLFTLAKVTVEKEHVTGLSLEDRLLLLSFYAQRHAGNGVAAVNRGLYYEQAQAFRALLGEQAALSFVVGMDKLLQILDPKYYQDREAALQQLFALTSLIVANRGAMARAEFERILDQPDNRVYRQHIHFCPLPDEVADVSATAVRDGLAAGRNIEGLVPEETAAFLAETRAFSPPVLQGGVLVDAYALRLERLAQAYAEHAD
ncbi:MAG: hypothetical protein HYZ50_20630 [Deltaproteobacteria bacterium]|nr:hypothetical protein [Deltaproteobacteria bacterium]